MPVKMFAGAYKGEAPNAAVAVVLELDASKFDFVEANGTFNETIEIANAGHQLHRQGVSGRTHTANLTLKPDTYKRATERGLPRGDAGEPAAGPLSAADGRRQQERGSRGACSTTSRSRTSTRSRSR